MVSPRLVAKIEAEEPTLRLAVLIDADNAQAAVIEGLLAEIARFAYTETSPPLQVLLGKKFFKNMPLSQCSSLRTQQAKMLRTAR